MSHPTLKIATERLWREIGHGKSAAAITDHRHSLTRAKVELIVEKAIAEYNATPHPGLGNVADPASRLRLKAKAGRLRSHVVNGLSQFGRPGDDA